jgi:hypothetical protein
MTTRERIDVLTYATKVRFFEKRLAPVGDCWEWTGAQHLSAKGGGPYGRACIGGRGGEWWYAHRLSWELHRGSIPDGLTIDHLCRNTLCVNPDHLEPVPNRINSLRHGTHYRASNPLCPEGHDEWIYRNTARQGRYCAECNRTRKKETK